jgi:hypothetical protein
MSFSTTPSDTSDTSAAAATHPLSAASAFRLLRDSIPSVVGPWGDQNEANKTEKKAGDPLNSSAVPEFEGSDTASHSDLASHVDSLKLKVEELKRQRAELQRIVSASQKWCKDHYNPFAAAVSVITNSNQQLRENPVFHPPPPPFVKPHHQPHHHHKQQQSVFGAQPPAFSAQATGFAQPTVFSAQSPAFGAQATGFAQPPVFSAQSPAFGTPRQNSGFAPLHQVPHASTKFCNYGLLCKKIQSGCPFMH